MKANLPNTSLDTQIKAYLTHQRALGRGYQNEERVLYALRNFLCHEGMTDLNQVNFGRWCQQLSYLNANTRRRHQLIVRKFCRYRHRTEQLCYVPDPANFARPRPYRVPLLIEPEQIAQMLTHACMLAPSVNSPLRAPVLRLAVVLLYTAGLRRGELLRLTLGDVDSTAGNLHVRESKFHKSRLVPLSKSACQELCRYLRARQAAGCDIRANAPLLCNRSRGWRPYTGTGLSDGIKLLFNKAHITDDQERHPRIHDLRHSFAVQALIRLYKRGADVQSCLPQLSLYMGHVSIVSTAYYLHFVPTIAQLASERFAQHCDHIVNGSLR